MVPSSMRGYVGRRLCRVGRTVEDADEDAKDGTGAELRQMDGWMVESE